MLIATAMNLGLQSSFLVLHMQANLHLLTHGGRTGARSPLPTAASLTNTHGTWKEAAVTCYLVTPTF